MAGEGTPADEKVILALGGTPERMGFCLNKLFGHEFSSKKDAGQDLPFPFATEITVCDACMQWGDWLVWGRSGVSVNHAVPFDWMQLRCADVEWIGGYHPGTVARIIHR